MQEVFGGLQEAPGGVWEASRRLLEAKLANSLVFSKVSCSPPGAPRDPPGLREDAKWKVKPLFRGAAGLQDSRICKLIYNKKVGL